MRIVHTHRKQGYDYSDDTEFSYNATNTLVTSVIGGRFKVFGETSSQLQGTVRTAIELNIDEAKKLRDELTKFLNSSNY